MKVSVFFAWYDFWVGVFIDRKANTVYICPLPMLVIKIQKRSNYHCYHCAQHKEESEMGYYATHAENGRHCGYCMECLRTLNGWE